MRLGFINSLQFKLAIVFLLASVVPLSIVGLHSVRTADGLIESIVINQLENVASEKQQLLQRWIAERKADLEVVAASAIVKSMDPAQIAPYLKLVQDQYEVYRRFLVAGGDGKIIFDTAPDAAVDPAGEIWFQRAKSGQKYLSDVHLDDQGHGSVFLIATPMLDADGAPLGVVCATVSTEGILKWVLKVSLGETGECYLVDKTGTFLAHKDPRRILKDNIAQSGSFANIFRGQGPRPIYNDYRGIPVLGASRDISDTKWYVVVEQDRDEAFAPSYKLRRNIYLTILFTVLGAVGLSLSLAYYVSSPIRTLNLAAHALAQGDFDNSLIHATISRRDEIGMLHKAFEHMAGQLRDRQNMLEARVGSTEAELHQTDLRLQDTIEAAARSEHLAALGRLASGVAHEIRTPLASLKLYLQSLQEDISISPELSEDFDIGMRQVERIEETINHFLNFARPQEPVLSNLDFRKLIDDSLMIVQPRANHQGVTIYASLASDLPPVMGDMRQLGDALVNLLVNALEEMHRGGRLNIRVEPVTKDEDDKTGSWVRIDVADNGPGIKQADMDKLFEPFFTTKASGSGLGLTIVRGTVQRHGGTVRVSSIPGTGATFSIILPAS
jgi:two-component system, NtrC family, sensor kinase